jgi:hypothetical protein
MEPGESIEILLSQQNSSSGVLRSAVDVAGFEFVRQQPSAAGGRAEDLGRSGGPWGNTPTGVLASPPR